MITPPRTIELLLASLGAETNFRDAVIGDLAEEFATRADSDGISAARGWYYREALRATPHLTYSSLRRMGVKGVWHRLGIVLSAYTIMLVTSLLPLSVLASVALGFGGWGIVWRQIWQSTPAMLGLLAAEMAIAAFGGYVAAVFDRETPLISAGMLGTLWPSVTLTAGAVFQAVVTVPPPASPVPLWYRSTMLASIPILTVIGGVLRVNTRKTASDEDLVNTGA